MCVNDLCPPSPKYKCLRIAFPFDIGSTNLNIYRDNILIKEYPPIQFEGCGAKGSRVICCSRLGRPTSAKHVKKGGELEENKLNIACFPMNS